ncbi:hypothetical protein R6Q57_009110 [Mikania cordata]
MHFVNVILEGDYPIPLPSVVWRRYRNDAADMSSSDEMEELHDNLDFDQIDELMVHPWLQFPQGTVARSRRDRLLRKEMGQQKAIDYDLLAELGQLERMTAIIGEDTPWSRLFEMTFAPQYRLITVEFLSTFVYRPRGPDYQPQAGAQPSEISFRLCGFVYELSLAEFGNALGLYTEQELRCRSTRRLFIQLTMSSSVLGGLGSATSCLSELPGSRIYVTHSFVICTRSLLRLLQDVA